MLDQHLSTATKEAIITAAIQTKMDNITILALYFIQTSQLSEDLVHNAKLFGKEQLNLL